MKRILITSSLLLLIGCSANDSIDVIYEMPSSASFYNSSQSSNIAFSSSSQSSDFFNASLPSSVLIRVPFTVQAPFANWDDPYQEACEEASLIMVHSYLNQSALNPESADKAIIDIIKWEEKNGFPQDVTIKQLSEIAKQYFGYETEVIENPSIEDIKNQIANGNPVIMPAAGRKLGNPYFSGEGPWYHMLVIIGYKGNKFITNDPGTKRGENYMYDFDILMNAIHDWTGVKEEIETGGSRILIIHQKSKTVKQFLI